MRALILAGFGLASIAAPAAAQDQAPGREPTVFDGDNITIAVGGGYGPSYEGSDDYRFFPAPLIRGNVGGFEFMTRGPGLTVDLIREPRDSKINLQLGPAFSVNLNRTSGIKDPVVKLLGKKDAAIQGGGFAGVGINRVLSPYDSLIMRVDVVTDLGNEHNGTLITPSIAYFTPVSKAAFVSLDASITRASSNYMRSYFGVTPAESVASGLPVYTPGAEWKDMSFGMFAGYDLSGDARDGGLSLFTRISYSRLRGDAAASPLVSIRGDRSQWFVAGGLAYTF